MSDSKPLGENVHTIIVDWDGTAVPQQWPDRATTFMPGFVEAMEEFHRAGFKLVIASARLSPIDPFTGKERAQAYVHGEVAWMRHMLDEAGLTYVHIWTKPGKPGGSIYIDDRAERYGGRPGSWRAMTEKVLTRLGKEEALFPYVHEEVA